LIEVSKIQGFVLIRALDGNGKNDILKIMMSPRISTAQKKFEQDVCIIKDSGIYALNNTIKENKIKCVVDDSFKKYRETMIKEAPASPKSSELILEVGVVNTKIRGSNIPSDEIQKVTRFFLTAAINVKSYIDGKWDGYINLYSKTTKTFPTGLLSAVTKILDKKKIKYTVNINYEQHPSRSLPFEVDWGNIKPDIDQVDAIEAAVKYGRGIVKAPTGWGKTAVFARGVISSLGVPTLFVANKKQLLDDAASDFKNGIKNATCVAIKDGMFGSLKLTPSSTAEEIANALNAPIIVATIQSLAARLKDDRTKDVLLDWLHNVCKLVIVDESQAVGTDMWDFVLNDIYAPYRILLSATP